MAKQQDAFLEQVLAQLVDMTGLRSRAMFGGWGLYAGKRFFGIVYRGRLYLKTTPATVARYTAEGMGPLRPSAKQTLWDYYEVPRAIVESEQLLTWAEEAASPPGDC
jgi:DNA transformation protein